LRFGLCAGSFVSSHGLKAGPSPPTGSLGTAEVERERRGRRSILEHGDSDRDSSLAPHWTQEQEANDRDKENFRNEIRRSAASSTPLSQRTEKYAAAAATTTAARAVQPAAAGGGWARGEQREKYLGQQSGAAATPAAPHIRFAADGGSSEEDRERAGSEQRGGDRTRRPAARRGMCRAQGTEEDLGSIYATRERR